MSEKKKVRVVITNKQILEEKENIFRNSFIFNKNDEKEKDKVIYITDFDYTLTEKYNYTTGERYESSYGMYDQDTFGGNQKEYYEKHMNLCKEYTKYEEDTNGTYSEQLKKEKILEWNHKALTLMIHPEFSFDSVKKMVDKKYGKFTKFKKNLKEFYEKLIELNIPIIIISGGVKEIIMEMLKLLDIKNLDDYFRRKRIFIIANSLKFDEKSKKCIGYDKDIIFAYNKSDHVKNLIYENFPNFENVFVLGDLETDYTSINDLNLNKDKNIIGIGFVYLNPKDANKDNNDIDVNNNSMIKSYQQFYDINILMDEGYDYLIQLLNIFKK